MKWIIIKYRLLWIACRLGFHTTVNFTYKGKKQGRKCMFCGKGFDDN